ncbi:MAG: hypothetical protein RL748_2164 [Pseudomonadota bacterium]
MNIVIDTIESTAKLIGFTNMPSFRVHFSSAVFKGIARFVPASGTSDQCKGSQFGVEICQEYVTDFRILDSPNLARIDSTGEDGCFHVCGAIHAVMDCSELAGNRITYAAVGDAIFTLTLADTCGLKPNEGTVVEFIAHDISLWDDEI